MNFSGDNEKLAGSCHKSEAACCKKGKVFLPNDQYGKILSWLEQNSIAEEIIEFNSRCENHEAYYLYDQRSHCQSLDERNLCRLHVDGVKPLECFWWPLHVYVDAQGALFVGSADYCCSGCRSSDVVDHLRQMEQQAEAIGKEVSGSLQIA